MFIDLNNHPDCTFILGPPGTGKTTRLMSILQESIARIPDLGRIGFLTFTKAAEQEAKHRIAQEVADPAIVKQLTYVRTLHSFSYYQLQLNQNRVFNWKHRKDFAKIANLHLPYKKDSGDTDAFDSLSADEKYLFIEGLAKARMEPLAQTFSEKSGPDLTWLKMQFISDALRSYKEKNRVLGFDDMIQKQIESGWFPEFDVLLLDEAQDFSKLQWKLVEMIMRNSREVYIAGDDDQAIHTWAGADVNTFVKNKGTKEIVLGQSYRLPSKLKEFSEIVTSQIKVRKKKEFKPNLQGGQIEYISNLEELTMDSGTWLLVARHHKMLKEYQDFCLHAGLNYSLCGIPVSESAEYKAIANYTRFKNGQVLSQDEWDFVNKFLPKDELLRKKIMLEIPVWHEALTELPLEKQVYFRAARRRGESFVKTPRIRINTIHGVKGQEADNVVLRLDMFSGAYTELENGSDDELRVWYVGLTRAKENLFLYSTTPKTFQTFLDC